VNLRQALAALLWLPPIQNICVATIGSADVIVMECDFPLSEKQSDMLRIRMKDVWPTNRVIVCDRGVRLKALRQEPAA
jgi:hypothetical protein